MPLTDTACKKAAPRDKLYKLTDEKGLRLRVSPSGAKHWEWCFSFLGVQSTLSIGPYPEVSLAEARERRAKGRELLRDGLDPRGAMGAGAAKAAVEKAHVEKREEIDGRFDRFALDWFQVQKAGGRWAEEYTPRIWNRLALHVLPYLGHRQIAEITPKDVLEVLRRMERDGLSESVRMVRGYMSQIFRFGIVEEYITMDPSRDVVHLLIPQKKVVPQPSVAPDELPEFFADLNRPHKDFEMTRIALRLTMHTVLRSKELREGRWEQIKGTEWHVPQGQMKRVKGESLAHVVPLSRQSLALLDRLREITGDSPRMFPGRRPGNPMSENTILFALYGMGWKDRATGHGFRSTFSTHLHEVADVTGFHSDLIEFQLAHHDRNGVRAAYNKAKYLNQRHGMMQWWSNYLDEQEAKSRAIYDPELADLLS